MKLLFIANCHARPLSTLAGIIAPGVESDWIEVNVLTESDRATVEAKIAAADLVLYYPVADSWRNDFVRTAHIRATARHSLSLTNVYFEGLHPDITLVGRGGARLQGPLADYHSRTAVFAWRAGLSVAETCALIESPEAADRVGYRASWGRSMAELHRRADAADIAYAARFEEIVQERLPLFVMNHPVTFLFDDYVRRILDHIGIAHQPMPADCFPSWLLAGAIFPVFPYIRLWNALPYEVSLFKAANAERYFTLPMFVEQCFARYRDYADADMAIMNDGDQLWRPSFSALLDRPL